MKLENLEKINELIKKYSWGWDAEITKLNCNYFSHEVEMCHEDGEDVEIVYQFTGCFKVNFESIKFFNWRGRDKDGNEINKIELNTGQIQCLFHSIDVSIKTLDNIDYYVCKIDIYPTEIEIWCRNIEIFKKEMRNITSEVNSRN
ncbi:MAG: hypothetical protein FWE02_01760 [Defluviitaleaceae bacterium]|nr:hypothetical protein [Defluviitaleaceae bacterium]